MEQINCTLTFTPNNSKASINGIDSNIFQIDYSRDIDLTPLVRLLSQKIEEGKKIELTYSVDEHEQTDKEKILFDTLKKIFCSYNQSFGEILDQGFTTNSNDTLTNSDDLPF